MTNADTMTKPRALERIQKRPEAYVGANLHGL